MAALILRIAATALLVAAAFKLPAPWGVAVWPGAYFLGEAIANALANLREGR